MATYSPSKARVSEKKENEVIFAQPVPEDYNVNNSNDDKNNGGADNNDDQKHNDADDDIEDVDITNTQTKNVSRRTTSSKKVGRSKTTLPKEWIDNWKVKETSRSDGRIDKIYRHTKDKGVTLRSFIAVEEYENNKKLLGIKKEKVNNMEKNHNTNAESSGAGGSLGQTPEQVELELKVLQAFEFYPPQKLTGIHRNFVLYGLMDYLKRSFDRDFSSEEVLELVDRFYNLEMLSDDQEFDMLNHEQDFSLPKSFFAKEKNTKKKKKHQ